MFGAVCVLERMAETGNGGGEFLCRYVKVFCCTLRLPLFRTLYVFLSFWKNLPNVPSLNVPKKCGLGRFFQNDKTEREDTVAQLQRRRILPE